MRSNYGIRIDALALVGVVLMGVMGINLLFGGGESDSAAAAQIFSTSPTPPPAFPDDPAAIIPPYAEYILTQGPHGFSYGQMAIDITAGKGATIRSPIRGEVTALYIDELGNTTLVIENAFYTVTLMHGDYTVQVGDQLALGQPVGMESNNGNTIDYLGRSCRGRDCGYHTHINIFDKRLGTNVNPLELFGK